MTVDINFQVLNTKDPATILIGDTSLNWGVAENQPAWLQITPPGHVQPINLNFTKHKLMILTSVSLGLSCVSADCGGQTYEDLPDGIWEFCLQSNFEGINKKRFHLKDDQLRQEIDKIRINLYDTQGFAFVRNQITDQLEVIEDILSASHSLIKKSRNNDAMKGYNEVSKLVEKLNKCKDCI